MKISVVYALPDQATVLELELPEGSTVAAAIEQCRGVAELRDLIGQTMSVGIYGKAVAMGTVLHEGDRVELYRPLQVDPKQARRSRTRKPKG